MSRRLTTSDPGFDAAFQDLVAARAEATGAVHDTVRRIIDDVRRRGEPAVRDYAERFDGLSPAAPLVFAPDELEDARARCAPADLAALEAAAERIRSFHARQRPQDIEFTDDLGVRQGVRHSAIDSVGLYVPGGSAAYPSSVLMNAIPARIAGCRRLVMTVPAPQGQISPLVLAAALTAGIDEVWRLGGAQAIAALAFGTATLMRVDKIVGPGNAYVAEAKRQVFGRVGIDMVAGPSEVVVVADDSAEPAWLAADLLSQAEHDEAAQAILITDDAALADAVEGTVEDQLHTLDRRATATASWRAHGALIVTRDLGEVPALVDALAPEHLELVVRDPEPLFASIAHAGSVFIGGYTPEVIGDYVGGPNHVLPTGRSARFASGLGVMDFVKRTTFLECTRAAFGVLGPIAERLATAEGLGAHARAIAIRLDHDPGGGS